MAQVATVHTAGAGRPRDERIDDRVIEATIELLEEVGFAGTTIAAISRRAGVPAPSIYRRWSNRVEVIEAAVFPERDVTVRAPVGDLRADLQAYLDTISAALRRPAAKAALPGLLSEYLADPEGYNGITFRVAQPIREAFHDLLRQQPPGTVDHDVDPDSVLDLMAASVLYAIFIRPFTGRDEPRTSTVDLVLRALRSPARPSTRRRTRASSSTTPTNTRPRRAS